MIDSHQRGVKKVILVFGNWGWGNSTITLISRLAVTGQRYALSYLGYNSILCFFRLSVAVSHHSKYLKERKAISATGCKFWCKKNLSSYPLTMPTRPSTSIYQHLPLPNTVIKTRNVKLLLNFVVNSEATTPPSRNTQRKSLLHWVQTKTQQPCRGHAAVVTTTKMGITFRVIPVCVVGYPESFRSLWL